MTDIWMCETYGHGSVVDGVCVLCKNPAENDEARARIWMCEEYGHGSVVGGVCVLCHKTLIKQKEQIMNNMSHTIKVQNVYTHKNYRVCERHDDPAWVGDVQIQDTRHQGECDICRDLAETPYDPSGNAVPFTFGVNNDDL